MPLYLGRTQIGDVNTTFKNTSDINLQTKTVSPTETVQTIKADSAYDGLNQVTVNAISKTYVGSSVTKKAAATYTPGTSDQTIVAGQYLNGAQTIKGDANLIASNIVKGKTIFGVTGNAVTSSGTVSYDTPSITVSTSGLITASANGVSNTKQLSTQAATTITPGTSDKTAVNANYYTTGAITVKGDTNLVAANIVQGKTIFGVTGSAVTSSGTVSYDTPSITVSTAGLITASANGKNGTKQLTVQAAKTITPSTSVQTAVAAGYYTTGAVSVAAIQTESKTVTANGTVTPSSGKYLTAVTVNIPIVSYYTGSSTPASSLGSNGDIYLKE